MVYVPKMPRWVESMSSLNPCELESYAGYTLLAFRQVKFQCYNFFECEKWMESCALEKWESTLNLCVHAHGPDVELIMEASCNNNYFLDIISSGIGELILRNRGSDHDCSSLVPFLGQVKSLVFCRSIRLPNLYYDLPSSITPGISRISCHCTTSYELLMEYYLTLSLSLHGFWVVCQPRTPISESIPHSDSITLSHFCCLRV